MVVHQWHYSTCARSVYKVKRSNVTEVKVTKLFTSDVRLVAFYHLSPQQWRLTNWHGLMVPRRIMWSLTDGCGASCRHITTRSICAVTYLFFDRTQASVSATWTTPATPSRTASSRRRVSSLSGRRPHRSDRGARTWWPVGRPLPTAADAMSPGHRQHRSVRSMYVHYAVSTTV